MYQYHLAGLDFASALPLPDLGVLELTDADARAGTADVAIGEGVVPMSDDGPAPPGTISWSGIPGYCLLDVANVARFEVRDGRRITVERTGELGDDVMRLYLLGSVLGALWHQRGRLPLHAGALAIDDRAWAFVGASGAGKSSLVVTLAAVAGAGYLCDDVCVVDISPQAGVCAWPGLFRMRVSPDMCALLGLDALPDLGAIDPFGKRALVPPWPRPVGPLPLAGVMVLEVDSGDADPQLERLGAVDAITALLAHTYRREYIPAAGRGAHFSQCAELARTVPVYRLRRSWGTGRMRADALHISQMLAALARAS